VGYHTSPDSEIKEEVVVITEKEEQDGVVIPIRGKKEFLVGLVEIPGSVLPEVCSYHITLLSLSHSFTQLFSSV
jgi:hypothetical protein